MSNHVVRTNRHLGISLRLAILFFASAISGVSAEILHVGDKSPSAYKPVDGTLQSHDVRRIVVEKEKQKKENISVSSPRLVRMAQAEPELVSNEENDNYNRAAITLSREPNNANRNEMTKALNLLRAAAAKSEVARRALARALKKQIAEDYQDFELETAKVLAGVHKQAFADEVVRTALYVGIYEGTDDVMEHLVTNVFMKLSPADKNIAWTHIVARRGKELKDPDKDDVLLERLDDLKDRIWPGKNWPK